MDYICARQKTVNKTIVYCIINKGDKGEGGRQGGREEERERERERGREREREVININMEI